MITMTGKYQTRGSIQNPSRPVRILAIDLKSRTPVVGVLTADLSDGQDHPWVWTADGHWGGIHDRDVSYYESYDLIPVPTKHEGYCLINLSHGNFVTASGCTWPSAKMAASQLPGDGYVDTIVVAHVTWES